jgi:hypothetical protein
MAEIHSELIEQHQSGLILSSMKRDLSPTAPTPVIAAALRRGRRASVKRAGEGAGIENPMDNYVAEGRVTRRFRLKKRKKAGAGPGNFNAVTLLGRKPEDIALSHRIAGLMRSARLLVRAVNHDLRERQNESKKA